MSEYYFITQKIITDENTVILGDIDSDVELEAIDLLNGAKLNPEPSYINIQLSKNGGDFFPDVFDSLVTLFSNKVKNCLDSCGIKNIDYFPVKLFDQKTDSVNTDYWLVNVLGRISCLDIENSVTEVDVYGDGVDFESFSIKESRTMGAELFRLHEDGTLIILNERVYSALSSANLKGVILENTKNFDGDGM